VGRTSETECVSNAASVKMASDDDVVVAEAPSPDAAEFEKMFETVAAARASVEEGMSNNLESYERMASAVDEEWRDVNPEQHAKLMLEVCKPLSSGAFEDSRRYDIARRYAVSALKQADKIPVATELELVGHVVTLCIGPNATVGEEYARRRAEDTALRLHAWKRLLDAIDPNWDPNATWFAKPVPPAETGLPAGVAPEAIAGEKLRKEYEAAIERTRQKSEEYSTQNRLRKWLKRFPQRAEKDIIAAYSRPPFDTDALAELLDNYLPKEEARTRIIDKVVANTSR